MLQRIVFILLFSFSLHNSYAQKIRMSWSELSSPSVMPMSIVRAEGKNNLWICDKKKYLYHWNGKQWKTFLLPQHDDILLAEYFYAIADNIFFAITNKQYCTSYYRFTIDHWEKIWHTVETRTQNITALSDSSMYIWGDRGSLVKVTRNVWSKIETPFKNHIVAFLEIDRGQYLISVRSEGIFRYDGETFIPVIIPERYRGNIVRLLKSRSEIFALSANQHVLKYDGTTFTESSVPAQDISGEYLEDHFGFSRVSISQAGQQDLFTEIPRNVRIFHHALIDSHTVVATTEKGNIFIGEKTSTGYFVDVTNAYNVAANPEYPILKALPSDINNDGLVDVVLMNKQKKYGATILLNNGNAAFSQDSKLTQFINTEYFITSTITDINGDLSPDIIVARADTSGIVIEIYEQDEVNGFQQTVTVNAKQLYDARKLTALQSFDYDFDGDNDLILSFYYDQHMQKGFVAILENSWWGRSFMVDTTIISQTRGWNEGLHIANLNNNITPEIVVLNRWGENIVLEYRAEKWKSRASDHYAAILQSRIQNIVFEDIDHDGDNDGILLSDSGGIQLLRNEGNKKLKIDTGDIVSEEITKNNNLWLSISSADFNSDEFPDIVISTAERNYLLINNHGINFSEQTNTYRFSNPVLKKLLVMDIDNDRDMDIFGYNDDRSVLFENTTDPSGRVSHYQLEIHSGRKTGIVAFVSSIPGVLFRFFVKTEIQLYLIVIVLSFLIIWSGLRIGKSHFQWETNIQLWFVSGNMVLFWILSTFTYRDEFILKHVMPLVIVGLGTGIPLVLYGIVRKKILSQESEKALHRHLLETVIEFMHGQWAVKNLNGLMLYCSDMAAMEHHEPKMVEQLSQRKMMFFEMTLPRLQTMCMLASKTGIHSAIARDIQERLDQIQNILLSRSWLEREQLSSVSAALKSLKSMINEYRDKVLKEYSCNPVLVLEQVVSIIKNEEGQNISLHTHRLEDSGNVLIKNFELADIIDNCVRNGIRAAKQIRQPSISLSIYRHSPKICFDIFDNGTGIPKENWEKIFQKGYSENRSTGLGLSLAKETLEKYGGRIFVKQSAIHEGTTFTIELNEVP